MYEIPEKLESPELAGIHFDTVAFDLIRNMPMGVIAFDANLIISDSNHQGQDILHCQKHQNIAAILTAATGHNCDTDWVEIISNALQGTKSVTFDDLEFKNNDVDLVLRIICIPMKTEYDHECPGGVFLVEDITSYVRMQQELAMTEKLASVGKLAAKVAHELNNPLDGILRYLNLAVRVLQESNQDQPIKYLEQCQKGVLRMAKIVNELLDFSRSSTQATQQANINDIIVDAIKSMQPLANDKKIIIKQNLADNMPSIRSGNLFQVFTNLIKNAIDAMRYDGSISINSNIINNNIVIAFADTGAGIDDDIVDKIFEPFFTTKESGKGTGLGLAICKDIVQRYNGTIIAKNKTDRTGTIFTINIPIQSTSWVKGQENYRGK
ncbi:MAG: GHKL domain-containing protein [Phycisphaerae bacterium]|nr:GHKL domain-containing protein [Phycisphaerae bacterium]